MAPQQTKIAGTDNGNLLPTSEAQDVDIYFCNSPDFRSFHAVGVWYGGDPQQNLHLSFYTERTPLPEKVVLKINPDGTPAGYDESRQVVKKCIVREIKADISLTIPAAVDLYKSLGDNLKNLKAI
jgi:hypothetical protein